MERNRLNPTPAPGAASILNEKLIAQFCDLLKRGLPADGVCDYLGIQSSTYWTWLTKGDKYLKGNHKPAEFAIYGQFVLAFRRALAEYRLSVTDRLSRAGDAMWIRDMTILERRDRKSWGKQDQAGGNDDQFNPDERFL